MALRVTGKVVLDTNIFIDYLRDERYPEWVFGQVSNVVRFLSSVVLLELRLGCNTPARTRAVNRIKAAFPTSRLIAPAPDLYDLAGTLFRSLYRDGNQGGDRLGSMNDILISLTAWRIGATVLTRNEAEFGRIQRRLPGLRMSVPSD